MHRKLLVIILAMGISPLASAAVTQDNFLVRSTQDIVDLCKAGEKDPLYTAAVNFCQGYLVGAYDYYRASVAGPKKKPFVCPPEPAPSRNEAIQEFVKWAQANPQYMKDPAVETQFRFLVEKWPCPTKPKKK